METEAGDTFPLRYSLFPHVPPYIREMIKFVLEEIHFVKTLFSIDLNIIYYCFE